MAREKETRKKAKILSKLMSPVRRIEKRIKKWAEDRMRERAEELRRERGFYEAIEVKERKRK